MEINPISGASGSPSLKKFYPGMVYSQIIFKLHVLAAMLALNKKRELQSLLGIINYLGKFSPASAQVCELLRNPMSAKSEWKWKSTYQNFYKKVKPIIKTQCAWLSAMRKGHCNLNEMPLVLVQEQVFCRQGLKCDSNKMSTRQYSTVLSCIC